MKKIAASSATLNTTRDSGASEGKNKRGDKKFFLKNILSVVEAHFE